MSYKILIVDDEPANSRTLARLFREDYEVLTAASGDEALALLGQHDVALLITDQRMPGMTGIELLKKTVPLRPRMVRIILTGYTDVDALVEAIRGAPNSTTPISAWFRASAEFNNLRCLMMAADRTRSSLPRVKRPSFPKQTF